MDIEYRVNQLSERFLNTTNVDFKIEHFDDRQLSPRGWQYKRYGNSTKGKDKLLYCRNNMELIEDKGRCARNDSDPRYYEELIFKENNTLIQVSTSPSRSGRTCSYTFLTITIIQ